jgi:hypothetical protein
MLGVWSFLYISLSRVTGHWIFLWKSSSVTAETSETRALSCNRVLSCTNWSFLATEFSLAIEKRDFSISLQNFRYAIRFYVHFFQPVHLWLLGVCNSACISLPTTVSIDMLGRLYHFICICLPTSSLEHSVCSSLPILEITDFYTSYVSQLDTFCCITNKCIVKCMGTWRLLKTIY